ncbi:MAG TPA: ABC transporter permease [Terriglobales bacterium]|nr:ABC transporter permease [Terriglobales bacterium]
MIDQIRETISRLLSLFRRDSLDRELDEELTAHIELATEENLQRGLSPEEARRQALVRLGGVQQATERQRESRGLPRLESLLQDVRYALRALRRSPGFASVAIVTLALGIGANTAIFTLINAVMLRSLPVTKPSELWNLGDDRFGGGGGGFVDDVSAYSYRGYEYLRDNTSEFSNLAAFQAGKIDLSVRRSGDPRPAEHHFGKLVSGNYFQTFGVSALVGRALVPEDDRPGAPPVAVMSYRAWHDRFASDRSVIGAVFTLRGVAVTIVGVTPPGFFGETLQVDPPDFWIPLHVGPLLNPENPQLNRWNDFWLYAIGRVRSGVQIPALQAHVTTEWQHWLSDNYSDPRYRRNIHKQHIVVTPAASGVSWMRDNYRSGLRLLLVVSALVLLIACANIANLLLARGTANRTQTAMRVALGASHLRIMQQSVIEGLVLALLGGIAGVWIAIATSRLILALAFRGADYVPITSSPSWPVLGFAFLISLIAGLVCSVAPAWLASTVPPADPMRGGARSTPESSALPQKSLMVLQAALSLVLLVGAGLLTESLRHLERQSFGFDTNGRLMVSVSPPTQYPPERLPEFYRRLEESLTRIPGVEDASYSLYGPMDFNGWSEPVSINGQEIVKPLEHGKWPWENRVSANYFLTVGTRILRGRAIDKHDLPDSAHVAVVNQAFARTFFPNQEAIGRHFGVEEPAHSGDYEIVGISEDTKYANAQNDADPMFFLPILQEEGKYLDTAQASEQLATHYLGSIQLRVNGQPEQFEPAVRRVLNDVDPDLIITAMRSFSQQIELNLTYNQMIARLTTLYGLLALALACVGLYGLSAYSVARRVHEIAIRMALGADRARVVTMIVRGAMTLVAIGLVIGVPVALASGKIIASQLFEVKTNDPLALGAAVIVLSACALAAAAIPARRAASVDPMQALRNE